MKRFYGDEIRRRLDSEEKYRELLFPRCYLFTDKRLTDNDRYPFYGRWSGAQVGGYTLYAQEKTHAYTAERDGVAAALVGHAFDPFTGVLDENEILTACIDAWRRDEAAFFDIVNRITGVFVIILAEGERLTAVQDCSGMQMLYYGRADGHIWMTSAPQLVGDVCGLKRTEYVMRLLNSRGYYRGSRFLPGDLSPYEELTRLGPNMVLRYDGEFTQRRFFPVTERRELSEEEKPRAIEEIYSLFRKNIEMILEKWDSAALSLTGGTDSKTTLACANGLYDRFMRYSFASKPSEKQDADAAAEICKKLGLSHKLYVIPEDENDIEDYDFLVKLIDHNTSYLCAFYKNELRKYIWLSRNHDYKTEIKSDASEIGRAIMQRKYRVRLPEVLAPRHFTAFHARYFFEPSLMRAADRANRSLMEKTGLTGPIKGYEHLTLYFWEVRLGSWYATSFHSQQFFGEVVIPYNNRRLMDMFYGFTYDERLNDVPHRLLMKRGNPAVADMNIHVKDSYFDKKRIFLETVYYLYATRLNIFGRRKAGK